MKDGTKKVLDIGESQQLVQMINFWEPAAI